MSYRWDKNSPLAYNNEMGRYKTERQLGFLRGILRGEKLDILDIGGGNGRICAPLSRLGHHVTVVDLSKGALDLLKEERHPNVVGIHSDILSYEPSKSFDAALAIDTVKYITSVSLERLFVKVNSLLSGNGLLFLSDINKKSWRNHLSVLRNREHLQFNIESADGYRASLEAAGFRIEKIAGLAWMPFRFNSNSPLVRLFKKIEEGLHLQSWISQSPWLLIAARKVRTIKS